MVLVTLGCASGAQADAAFEGSSPGNAETVAEPLTEIELRFSDPISLNETETRLLDADGTARMHLAGRNADLRPHAEFATIGELGGCIV